MSKSATVVALACQIVKLRDAARMWKQTAMAHREQAELQASVNERQLAEHRASFGARTKADQAIIEGLRAQLDTGANQIQELRTEIQRLQKRIFISDAEINKIDELVNHDREGSTADKVAEVVKERDGLREAAKGAHDEVAVLRPLVIEASKYKTECDSLRTRLRAEIAEKSPPNPTPKQHPVKVGDWVRRTGRPYPDSPIGTIRQVVSVFAYQYNIGNGDGWAFRYCEPCDPPVDHDTPAGKEAAEAAVQDVAIGDIVEVVSATRCAVGRCDVRKVTQ